MHTRLKVFYSVLVFCLAFIVLPQSCGETEEPDCCEEPENIAFDRQALLTSWADELIIPSFEKYVSSLKTLDDLAQELVLTEEPTIAQLESIRQAWVSCYKIWQSVSMFDIGMAETIGLRNFTNIYPTNTEKLADIVFRRETFNLELPSNFVIQGFPALDFLLYEAVYRGDGDGPLLILRSSAFKELLKQLTGRLLSLSSDVLDDWKSTYRDEFISNDGSSATASTDKLINDVIFYYEKFLRAGKIGIPAGVFSGTPLPETVEAPFSRVYSKDLLLTGLQRFQDFMNGKSEGGVNSTVGLDDYFLAVDATKDGEPLLSVINQQIESARNTANNLSNNFGEQIESDNLKLLETYDELQKVVVLLKVDMLQALNIKVDFVDADGD